MLTTRFLRQVALFSLMTVFAATFVQAQEGGRQRGGQGGRGFGGGGMMGGGMMGGMQLDRATLLRSDKVRQELKIEEAQGATIDAALDAYREERQSAPRPDREAMEKMTEEERIAFMEDSRKKREELSKKTDEILVALLDESQAKRLDEISLQTRMTMAPVAALKSDELKKSLSLTDEQIAKLEEAEKAAGDEMRKMFEGMRPGGGGGGAPGGGRGGAGGGNFEEMRTKMDEMRKKSADAAIAVLTDEQKTTLDGLKGAPFELDMRSLMGGFGGPGGRGGQGGGRGGRGGRPPAE